MLSSLSYHWRIHLAVLIGSAIATAVLTGALIVGDSVRGSLRDLTLQRLGRTESALLADRFFSERLAREVGGHPVILLSGSASTADEGARARGVQIVGVEEGFDGLYPANDDTSAGRDILDALDSATGFFPPVVINESLRGELSVDVGDALLLAFEDPSDVHRDFLLGSRNPTDLLETRRVIVADVISDTGPGRFGLRPYQTAPRNAFMRLADIQKALDRPNSANLSLIPLPAGSDPASETDGGSDLSAALQRAISLSDLSLSLRRAGDGVLFESPRYFLADEAVEAAEDVSSDLGFTASPALIYLANKIALGERSIPYSTVAGLDPTTLPKSSELTLLDGTPAPNLEDDELLLNAWAAEDLAARAGDRVEITYYQPEAAGHLIERTTEWRVRGIVRMTGTGADASLTPEFPGIENADDMASWDAPFPVDLEQIRPKDETYWDQYRAAPKAFVSLEAGRQLWSSRFGSTTSVHLLPDSLVGDMMSTEGLPALEQALLARIDPTEHGFVLAPLRDEGLRASEGATDFSGLFIGFSFFLILSAALLVALLFRLGVEHRSSEIGVLQAVGYPFGTIRRRFLAEGAILAAAGGLPGLAAGAGYASLMILGLTTWWQSAVGTSHLIVHIEASTLALGFVLSITVVVTSIALAFRQLRRRSVQSLLVRAIEPDADLQGRRSSISPRTLGWSSALAGGLLLLLLGGGRDPGVFFGAGALLLISGLSFLASWLRSAERPEKAIGQNLLAIRMGVRNARRRPGRSLVCATLIGCACFVIVAVGTNRKPPVSAAETLERTSGTGGYNLIARTDVPIYRDLGSADDRSELGISPEDGLVLEASEIVAFRVRPGDDASCLNLYRPQNPTVLGAQATFIEGDGFRFAAVSTPSEGEKANPWTVLRRTLGEAVPTIGDANSTQWILHLGLGDERVVSGPEGSDVRLRLEGTLQGSIFQSELLVSEERFMDGFPGTGGYRMFLIRTEPEKEEQVTEILEGALGRFGMDVVRSADRLSTFSAIENTYLSTFQTLGGLGLLLGTIGLGILLFRNVLERTGELAALRAFGYRRAVIRRALLAENGFLLIFGIAIGTVAAFLAAAPNLTTGHEIPWGSLSFTLALVLAFGLGSSAVAASVAMRRPLLAALKEER